VDGADRTRFHISAHDYEQFREQSKTFRGFAAALPNQVVLNDDSERPESIWIQSLTPGFLTMSGVRFGMGRDFLPEEGIDGNQYKAILGNRLWQSRFGGDPRILGKRIRLDGKEYAVVGVLAPGPRDHGLEPLWTSLAVRSAGLRQSDRVLTVIGLLKSGVHLAQAQAEIGGIAARLDAENVDADPSWSVHLEPYRNDWLNARVRANFWLLMSAVVFVLLIACLNVANLLVARGAMREKEAAVRASLGATRGRLFRQMLVETLVLFISGGLLGVALGWGLLRVLLAMLPASALPAMAITMSIPALLFTGTTTFMAGLIAGCAPAWRVARVDVNEQLKSGGNAGRSRRHYRLLRTLVVAECSLTLVLLAGAGLVMRSFWMRTHLDLGIRTDHILTFEIQAPRRLLRKPEQIELFDRELIEKIQALPGVTSAAALNTWGLLRETGVIPFAFGTAPADISKLPRTAIRVASPGFFETFGVRLVKGRAFTEADRAAGEPVAMVNERFAGAYMAGGKPGMRKLSIPAFPLGPFRIVGVYHDVQNAAQLGQPNLPEICLPFAQLPQWPAIIGVRTAGKPDMIARAVAGAIHSMDRELPMANVATMEEMVHERLRFDRFEATVYGAFAALALLLAVVGIHGVMAFIVAQQRRDIGVRMALGAEPAGIRRAVLREGMGLAAAGLALGAGFAWYGGQVLQSTLYGAHRLDGGTLVLMAGVLLAASALACSIPAARAAAVDPIIALRSE
jgi:putative ABC transport system permease protein